MAMAWKISLLVEESASTFGRGLEWLFVMSHPWFSQEKGLWYADKQLSVSVHLDRHWEHAFLITCCISSFYEHVSQDVSEHKTFQCTQN